MTDPETAVECQPGFGRTARCPSCDRRVVDGGYCPECEAGRDRRRDTT